MRERPIVPSSAESGRFGVTTLGNSFRPTTCTFSITAGTARRIAFSREFQWIRLVKQKYEVSSVPKIYSLLTPERDGQHLSVKIKAPVPMTIAVLPSKAADSGLRQPVNATIGTRQYFLQARGVQSMTFDCSFNVADGPQSIIIMPDASASSRKKAEIELQTVKCIANCDVKLIPNQ
jgi:hypothetical protein